MIRASALRGLYAITSEQICRSPAALPIAVEQALAGGARLIQYRDKRSDPEQRLRNARALATLCRRRGALLIVNDDPQLAAEAGADGVHLGRGDASLEQAREQLGRTAIIGMSCNGSLERALDAQRRGADYVAFGRFYPSATKPDAPPAPIELLGEARRRLSLPICAIGGIVPENAASLIAAGADLIAAVEGVFGAADVRAAAAAYAALFMKPARQDQ